MGQVKDATKKKVVQHKTLLSRRYFWVAVITPLLFFIVSFLIIIIDQTLSFCLTKGCLENVFIIFDIPIRFIYLTFILATAALTYYRVELAYEQNERQLEQAILTNYHSFREDFFTVLNEKNYEFKELHVSDYLLFNKLYPESRSGDNKLSQPVYDFIANSENGFLNVMDKIIYLCSDENKEINPFLAENYEPIVEMSVEFLRIAGLGVEGLETSKYDEFCGDYAEFVINIVNDFIHLVSIINIYEGHRFFDIKKRLNYKKAVAILNMRKHVGNDLNTAFKKLVSVLDGHDLNDSNVMPDLKYWMGSHLSKGILEEPFAIAMVYEYIIKTGGYSTKGDVYQEGLDQLMNRSN